MQDTKPSRNKPEERSPAKVQVSVGLPNAARSRPTSAIWCYQV